MQKWVVKRTAVVIAGGSPEGLTACGVYTDGGTTRSCLTSMYVLSRWRLLVK